jgi:hypothetical protein
MTTTPLDLNSDDTIDPNDPYIKAAKEEATRKAARKSKLRTTGGRPQAARDNWKSPNYGKRSKSKLQKGVYKVQPRTTGGRPTTPVDWKNSKQKSIEYHRIKAIKDAYINAENRVKKLAEDYANGVAVTNSEYQQAVANLKLAKQKYDTAVPPKSTSVKKFNPSVDLSPSETAKNNSVKATPTLPTDGVKIDWKNAFDPQADGSITFKLNNTLTPIAFIGGTNGQYIGNYGTNANSALNPASPIAFDNARSRIIQQYMNKPGGLVELKKMLNAHGLYGSPQQGTSSLSLGESPDAAFQSAMTLALQTITGLNAAAYSQNPNQSLLSFEDGVKAINLKYGGGGAASTNRTVRHVKFTEDQFDVAVDQLFQQTVGRGATKDELSNVVKLLQQYEKKHPDITVTHTSASGNTTVNTRGGVDQGTVDSIMQKAALNNPNAEGYTKGSKYVGWVNDIIMDPMQLGGM